MNKAVTILAIAAVLAVIFISGCTQQPSTGGGGGTTGQAIAAESAAQSAIEQEMEQAIANITTDDIENALLNQ